MSKHPAHERDEQILDLLDGGLPDEGQARLRGWLDASPEHWDRFVQLSFIHRQIADQLNSQRSSDGVRLEALQAVPVEDQLPPIHIESDALTKKKVVSALAYVVGQALTPGRLVMIGSVAAALLLAATLVVVLSGGEPTSGSRNIVQGPAGPDATPLIPAKTVATLTALHNAQWSERALAHGEPLKAGDRLTLTAGFAEITTGRGAVAILEAPATIELIDSPNALRLIAGKLVGICETESSKGFLVRTPHMDITDLGTRFGVDATSLATEVHVFEGEVQALRPDAPVGTEPTPLTAHQSARTSASTDVIVSIDHHAEIFAALLPTPIQLPGTGFGLRVGQPDPSWQIIAIDGQPLESPQTVRVDDRSKYVDLVPNDPERSQWLSWNPRIVQDHVCTFRTTVTLPDGIDPATARIEMRYYADAQVQAIRVNGNRRVLETCPTIFGTWEEHTAHITEYLKTGDNIIALDVANLQPTPGQGAGLVGLKLEWRLIAQTDWRQPAE
ncbi:MAG: FecR family protein [Phycisphaeraceae bacterium]|nr:FecR family protein [Phycisphaeraceae bacterium]